MFSRSSRYGLVRIRNVFLTLITEVLHLRTGAEKNSVLISMDLAAAAAAAARCGYSLSKQHI